MDTNRHRAADVYRDRLHRNDTSPARRWNQETPPEAVLNRERRGEGRVRVHEDNVSCSVCGRKWARGAAQNVAGVYMCPQEALRACQPDWRAALAAFTPAPGPVAPEPVVVPWWRRWFPWR